MFPNAKQGSVKILLPLIIIGLLTSCTQEPEPFEPQTRDQPLIIAKVNGEPVLREKIVAEYRNVRREYRLRKNNVSDEDQILWLRTKALNQVIQEKLLKQEAARQGIVVEENEFNAFRVQMMQGYQPDTFKKTLEVVEINEKDWDERVRTRLLIKKLIDHSVNSKVDITDDEIKKYFEAHREEFQKGEQVRALHIMVDTEEEARMILKSLEEGGDFPELAREHSQSLEGPEGGDMGYFEARHLPEEFEPIFHMKPEEISDIIQTPYGFHVFKVMDKKPASDRTYEESREEIQSLLLEKAQENAFKLWLKGLMDRAKIEIQHELLAKID